MEPFAACASSTLQRICDLGCANAIVATDGKGIVSFCSPAVQELFGCSPSEVVGKPVTDILPSSGKVWRTLVGRRRAEEGILSFSVSVAGKNGQEKRIQVAAAMLQTEEGRPAGAIAVCRDGGHAEARQPEASSANRLFESVLVHCAGARITLDAEGCISSWNAGAQALAGFRATEVVGLPLMTLLPGNTADANEMVSVSEVASGAAHPPHHTIPFRTSGGHVLEVLLIAKAP